MVISCGRLAKICQRYKNKAGSKHPQLLCASQFQPRASPPVQIHTKEDGMVAKQKIGEWAKKAVQSRRTEEIEKERDVRES